MLELNRIYNMDCLEGLKLIPNESVDLIITSPPYNLGKIHHTGNNRLLEEYCKIAEKRISETISNQIELPEIERNVPQRQFDWLDELLGGE